MLQLQLAKSVVLPRHVTIAFPVWDILQLKQTPLHLAVSKGNIAVCRLLVDKGARLDDQDEVINLMTVLAATKL